MHHLSRTAVNLLKMCVDLFIAVCLLIGHIGDVEFDFHRYSEKKCDVSVRSILKFITLHYVTVFRFYRGITSAWMMVIMLMRMMYSQ